MVIRFIQLQLVLAVPEKLRWVLPEIQAQILQ
jgi:hypothetical protein